jgi:hypothetical protein
MKETEITYNDKIPDSRYFIFLTTAHDGYQGWVGIGKIKHENYGSRVVRVDNALNFDGKKFYLKDDTVLDLESYGEELHHVHGYIPLTEAVINSIRPYTKKVVTPYDYRTTLVTFAKISSYTLDGYVQGVQATLSTPSPDGIIYGERCIGYLPKIKKEENIREYNF